MSSSDALNLREGRLFRVQNALIYHRANDCCLQQLKISAPNFPHSR